MSFNEKYTKISEPVTDKIILIQEYIYKLLSGDTGIIEKNIRDFLNLPSKHIRAVLSFLYIKACGHEINDKQIQYQTVIEIIHNASLIHDDIIDEADLRRGEKSFNANFGNHLSVIAGDLILAQALKILAELEIKELQILISDTIKNMCLGEIFQEYSKFKIPAINEYIEKTYNKTGALFEAALCGTDIISTGSINNNTKEFAKNFGIAFQIRDDLLNITDNKPDNDIENGIYTAPVIYSGNTNVSSSGIEKAKGLLNNYISNAKINIQDLKESEYKTAIYNLLELINHE